MVKWIYILTGGIRMTIDEYLLKTETYVSERFHNVKIISEVRIPYDAYSKITNTFKYILENTKHNEDNIIREMWLLAPKTCLVVTVNYAIYHYSGNFWGPFKKSLALRNDSLWRNNFYRTIGFEDLEVFNPDSSQKFISNILGHAGIPKGNVGEFLKNVIIPAASFNLDVEEIIEAIKSEKNSGSVVKSYGLYKGVTDFIKLDTSVTRDFLERCMEVWKEQERPFTEKHQGYLPDHILFEFEEFASNAANTKFEVASRNKKVNRPILNYSTTYQNIFIKFPVQRFNLNEHKEVKWVIRFLDEEKAISTFKVNSVENKESEFFVGKNNGEYPILPHTEYEIFLYVDNYMTGEWTFYNTDTYVFNSKTFELERRNIITADRILLVIHENQLKQVKALESYNTIYPLMGIWDNFYEVEVTIEGYTKLLIGEREIIVSNSSKWFELTGGTWENLKSDIACFNNVPTLTVSKDLFKQSKDMANWNIRIQHNWSNKSIREKVVDLPFILEDEYSVINIESLMEKAGFSFGKFTLSLTGDLGKDKRFSFNYIPENFMKITQDENETIFEHDTNIDFAFHSVLHVEKKSERLISIGNMVEQQKLEGIVLDKQTKEILPIVLYNSLFTIEIKNEDEFHNLGETFDTSSFNFSGSSVLVDLENPSLHSEHKALNITIFERLATNEVARKSYVIRTGRKHLIEMSFFANLNNTNPIRRVYIKIDEMKVEQHLFTVETQWGLTELKTSEDEMYQIDWNTSFNSPNRVARLWSLDNEPNIISTIDLAEGKNQWRMDSTTIPDGFYLFEIADVETDEFLALFSEVICPKEINSKTALISKGIDLESYSFTGWILLEDLFGEEIEWSLIDLKGKLEMIFNHKKLYMPLLRDSYSEICDFGLRNIDSLLQIFDEVNNPKYEEFLHQISGFQEWDLSSFNSVIARNLLSTSLYIDCTPSDLSSIHKMNYHELALSYQRSKRKEILIKGFSLRHEYLKHYSMLTQDKKYSEQVDLYLNTNQKKLDNLLDELEENELISKSLDRKLNNRRLDSKIMDLPYAMGLVAYGTATVFFAESRFTTEFIDELRELVPGLFELNEKWFIHDLVFWKSHLQNEEESTKKINDRRKQYEHTSFVWKK